MADEKDRELADLRRRVASLEGSKLAAPKSKGGLGRWLIFGFGGLLVLGAVGSLVPKTTPPPSPAAIASGDNRTATDTAGSTGNLISDKLLARSASDQANLLGKSVGDGCRGKRAFYMGTGKSGMSEGMSYWSLECRDRRRFLVQVSRDDKNSVMECSIYEKIAGGHCFRKLEGA